MFEEGEEDEFGKYGFKLVPNDDSRRCWYFRAEDDEEKKEWEEVCLFASLLLSLLITNSLNSLNSLKVFSNACRRAKPERYNIAIIRNSFDRAFQSLRFSYGYFGPLEVTGSEEEMLYDFIGSQILHRELLQDVFNSIPTGPEKQTQIAEIKLLVNKTVSNAVNTTWKKVLGNSLPLLSSYFFLPLSNPMNVHRLMQLALEETSSENRVTALHTIFGETYFLKFYNTIQIEQEIQSKICLQLANIVNPVISDMIVTTCIPLLATIIDSIVKAFSETVDGYRNNMETIVVALLSDDQQQTKQSSSTSPHSPILKTSSSVDEFSSPTNTPSGTPLETSPLSSSLLDDHHNNNTNLNNTPTNNSTSSTPLHNNAPLLTPSSSLIETDLLTTLLDNEHLNVSGRYNSGPLSAAHSTLWTMYTTNLNSPEISECLIRSGLNAYDIYTCVNDAIISLSHNGIYTFGLLLKQAIENQSQNQNQSDSSEINPQTGVSVSSCYSKHAEKVYVQCVNMMAADSMLTARKVLLDILNR